MTIGTWPSLWLLVLLLAVAASLTSYVLSRINALRGMRPAGRLAIAGATVLFLTAVTIALLSSSRLASLVSWNAHLLGDEEIAIPGRVLKIPGLIPQEEISAPNASEPTKATYRATSSRMGKPASAGTHVVDPSEVETTQGQSTQAQDRIDDRPIPRLAFRPEAVPPDIWAATRCLRLFRRNPDNVLRWTFENECDWPVGIAIESCNETRSECASVSLVLPYKRQRPVFDSDETVYGGDVRFRACYITDRQAYHLIGEPMEVRSTEEWRTEWAVVRSLDPCLARVLR